MKSFLGSFFAGLGAFVAFQLFVNASSGSDFVSGLGSLISMAASVIIVAPGFLLLQIIALRGFRERVSDLPWPAFLHSSFFFPLMTVFVAVRISRLLRALELPGLLHLGLLPAFAIYFQIVLFRRWMRFLADRFLNDEAQTERWVAVALVFLLGWQAWLYRRRIPWLKFAAALACQILLAPGAAYLLVMTRIDPIDEEPIPLLALFLVSAGLWIWGIVDNLSNPQCPWNRDSPKECT